MLRFSSVVLASVFITASLFAADPLPSSFDGTWKGYQAGNPYRVGTGNASITIKDQADPNAITGTMDWSGGRTCYMTGEPLNGKWDGSTLTVNTTFRSTLSGPAAWCVGPVTFVFKRTADGMFKTDDVHLPYNNIVNVTLSPKASATVH